MNDTTLIQGVLVDKEVVTPHAQACEERQNRPH